MSSRVSISPSALCMYMLWKDTFCSAPAALLYLRFNPVRIAYPCVKPSSCVIIRSTYFQYCSSPAGGFSTTHSHVPIFTSPQPFVSIMSTTLPHAQAPLTWPFATRILRITRGTRFVLAISLIEVGAVLLSQNGANQKSIQKRREAHSFQSFSIRTAQNTVPEETRGL